MRSKKNWRGITYWENNSRDWMILKKRRKCWNSRINRKIWSNSLKLKKLNRIEKGSRKYKSFKSKRSLKNIMIKSIKSSNRRESKRVLRLSGKLADRKLNQEFLKNIKLTEAGSERVRAPKNLLIKSRQSSKRPREILWKLSKNSRWSK